MFQLIKPDTRFNFVSKFPMAVIVSGILVLASLIMAATKMQYGVDFRGGAEIQAKFIQSVQLDEVRSVLSKSGFKGVSIQTIGEKSENEILLKVQGSADSLNQIAQKVSDTLNTSFASSGVEIRKVDIVGPKAGAQLRLSGFQAMAWAMIAIMIYIGLRFDFKYAPGAIVALFHDVSLILGLYAVTGTEFTLQTVAAILAVIGYSVNDTVIVYDRVREHEHKNTGVELKNHINNAINETLSRTILTSGTTLCVSMIMMFFGGGAISDFFMAMSAGVIVGTYSSIFIASPITLYLNKFKKTQAPVVA